jgi:hypothetical protein
MEVVAPKEEEENKWIWTAVYKVRESVLRVVIVIVKLKRCSGLDTYLGGGEQVICKDF